MKCQLRFAAAALGSILASALALHAETRKAGLWKITTTTTWQKSAGTSSFVDPASAGTRVHSVCLTQDMIDKWGALLPQSRGQCHIENKIMHSGGSSADWVCSGRMKGRGDLQTQWADMEHSTGTLHFKGTILVGNQEKQVEWTTVSSSAFESANCGATKPDGLPQGSGPRQTPAAARSGVQRR